MNLSAQIESLKKIKLAPKFTLEELVRSQTAVRLGFTEQYYPSEEVISNLRALATNTLQPLRTKLKRIIRVSSGYRCQRVNWHIGGSPKSQHQRGEASDFTIEGMSVEDAYNYIKRSDVPYDQLIQEFDAWIHISFSQKKNRRQNLRAVRRNGRVVYLRDLKP